MANPIFPVQEGNALGTVDGTSGNNDDEDCCHDKSHDNESGDDCDYDDDDSPTLFKLTGVDTNLRESVLEDALSQILSIPITLLETNFNGEEGAILFCGGCPDSSFPTNNRKTIDAHVLETIGKSLQEAGTSTNRDSQLFFLRDAASASISVVDEDEDDDCVEYITEEEAYQLWLEQNRFQDGETSEAHDSSIEEDHLVSSPDGSLVRPKHHGGYGCNPEEKKSDLEVEMEGTTKAFTTTTRNAATAKQLERDPGLLEVDNLVRVHYTEVLEYLSHKQKDVNDGKASSTPSWRDDFGSQPIVFYGLGQAENGNYAEAGANNRIHEELQAFQAALRDAIAQHGTDTIVRTGNRETLVQNGFHNSKPANLSDVGAVSRTLLGDRTGQDDANSAETGKNAETTNTADGTIVFNPIHEMPPAFHSETVLGKWIHAEATEPRKRVFPNQLWKALLAAPKSPTGETEQFDSDFDPASSPRFTLCMANEGFGIGMHKHGPALFFLTEGRKKWYLSHPTAIDDRIAAHAANGNGHDSSRSPTHPDFYRDLSTHKCLQEPGELLLVPNLWYHEIYNLASPTIGIQALADELPIPGTLASV